MTITGLRLYEPATEVLGAPAPELFGVGDDPEEERAWRRHLRPTLAE